MTAPEIMGLVAGGCTLVSMLPQIVKSYRTRRVRDLSVGMLVLLLIGAVLWLVYGAMIQQTPIVATNLIMLVFISSLIVMKGLWGRR